MPRNIEIKARIESIGAVSSAVAALSTEDPFQIDQEDTFFRCASGRLKLRIFSKDSGEIIFYRRANEPGPKESFYIRVPTSAPNALRDLLTLACGQLGRVRTHRTVYRTGRTRIHLDRVDDLGEFLELEVVLGDDEGSETGLREAHSIMDMLGIKPSQLVQGAYVDLLAAQAPLW